MVPLLILKLPMMLARSMRTMYGGLREEPCNDCCIHWCCSPCAICQGELRRIAHAAVLQDWRLVLPPNCSGLHECREPCLQLQCAVQHEMLLTGLHCLPCRGPRDQGETIRES